MTSYQPPSPGLSPELTATTTTSSPAALSPERRLTHQSQTSQPPPPQTRAATDPDHHPYHSRVTACGRHTREQEGKPASAWPARATKVAK
ncbi:uncharacterized protein A4U43_C03F25750 [Asparagus officinalis]|uniref:Uncharacterized protein n=1 Tax=Asparagus officinalis TaxID=4686 RepID=A0A5P1FH85_ASPOF|nr:uncharacterized protein A4U43_C03F25750 [Asparagus officinalis]